jgi:hypothetical protein
MGLYDHIAELPVRIEGYSVDGLARRAGASGWMRRTTVVALHGDGHDGVGEDVTWDEDAQLDQQARGAVLPIAGSWTVDSFSRALEDMEAFHGAEPAFPVYRSYRRWAFESAALDLALRQAGRPLHEVLDRSPRPLNFVVSLRLGEPASFEPVARRLEAYPGIRFKLDAEPHWSEELIEALAATDAVDVVDFKGAYKGTVVDVETDPGLYARVAEALPGAYLEDPDLEPPDARAALEPYPERITWDAPIHSVDDVLARAVLPRALNSKPSRFGSWRELMRFYDFCAERDILLYGGGQSELGPGRGQIQLLASLIHPDGPNDVAPAGHDWDDFPSDLPTSPLDPAPDGAGFRRRA